jgi:hypothetical protein
MPTAEGVPHSGPLSGMTNRPTSFPVSDLVGGVRLRMSQVRLPTEEANEHSSPS